MWKKEKQTGEIYVYKKVLIEQYLVKLTKMQAWTGTRIGEPFGSFGSNTNSKSVVSAPEREAYNHLCLRDKSLRHEYVFNIFLCELRYFLQIITLNIILTCTFTLVTTTSFYIDALGDDIHVSMIYNQRLE